MKCNLSLERRLPKNTKDELDKYILEQSEKYILKSNLDCIRRMHKLIALNLNKRYGFGRKRILDLFNDCGFGASEQQKYDEIFWHHVDKVVIEEIGILFEKENYEEMDK